MEAIKLPAQLGAYCKLDILDCNKKYICCCAREEDSEQIVSALNAQQTCGTYGTCGGSKVVAKYHGEVKDGVQKVERIERFPCPDCQPSGELAKELRDSANAYVQNMELTFEEGGLGRFYNRAIKVAARLDTLEKAKTTLWDALSLASYRLDVLTNWMQNSYKAPECDVKLGRGYAKAAKAALGEEVKDGKL